MTSSTLYSSLRRRSSPFLEALLVPGDLTAGGLIEMLVAVAHDLISSSSGKKMVFQRKNSRFLVYRVEVLAVLLESLKQTGLVYSYTSLLCFKELYLLLSRSKILLDYCFQSSKLWLLLQNMSISGHFNDLNQGISTLLDVLPFDELHLNEEVREQIELLQRQLRKAKLYIDKQDEVLRHRFYSLLTDFENGVPPDYAVLRSFFVDELGIQDSTSCRDEIEFLEEQLCNQDGDLEPSAALIHGFVALARYCRFLLFGFEEDRMEVMSEYQILMKKDLVNQHIDNATVIVPKDFCCPVSLDLMRDPVIISTGQTYDRASIVRWMDEGHCTCPKTGQMLSHKQLVPNRGLRNLITQWCTANGIAPDGADSSSEISGTTSFSKAAFEANKATSALLIKQLAEGAEDTKAVAAREIRLMAKNAKENRAYMAEAGAIPHLSKMLLSRNTNAQENSVTALLNLSIYEKNKSKIMEEEGCLERIVNVLRFGYTTEGRENAAATLFSLSAVHDYKSRIAEEEGAVEALAGMLKEGTARGKKDAVTALFNLCTHTENCRRMIEGGAVTALVGALEVEGVSEEAAGSLALIVRQSAGAEAVGQEDSAVASLIGMMRSGTPKGKENAVAALLEVCRSGGGAVTDTVFKAPAMATLLQTLLFSGSRRARRKAASLVRVFQRRQHAALYYGGYDHRDSEYSGEVPLSMSISVPVV